MSSSYMIYSYERHKCSKYIYLTLMSSTLDYNLEMQNKFIKYLLNSCGFDSG